MWHFTIINLPQHWSHHWWCLPPCNGSKVSIYRHVFKIVDFIVPKFSSKMVVLCRLEIRMHVLPYSPTIIHIILFAQIFFVFFSSNFHSTTRRAHIFTLYHATSSLRQQVKQDREKKRLLHKFLWNLIADLSSQILDQKKVMKTLLHFDPLAAAASAFMVDLVNFNHVVQPKLWSEKWMHLFNNLFLLNCMHGV